MKRPLEKAPHNRGQHVGYIRVSSVDQNTSRQLDGLELHKTFTDKASGKDTLRPELQNVMRYVREGDTLVVHSMDRLARNLHDLRVIVSELNGKGVMVQFVKENLTFTGDDSPMANLLLSVMGAVAQFERDLIRERQLEGIAQAKKQGVYKGRARVMTDQQAVEMVARVRAGEGKTDLAHEYGVSRAAIYGYLKRVEAGRVCPPQC
jgi:DNA invertase Pin-like site-specific DNA recombinase